MSTARKSKSTTAAPVAEESVAAPATAEVVPLRPSPTPMSRKLRHEPHVVDLNPRSEEHTSELQSH